MSTTLGAWALVLLIGVGPATTAVGPAPGEARTVTPADGLSVVELELIGVDPAAVATLPVEAPAPSGDTDAPQGGASALTAVTTPMPDVLTREMATAPYSVLGVTWDADPTLDGVVIRYRVRQNGAWTGWEAVGASDVAPDNGGLDTRRSGARNGTDPIVALDADGLQLWAESSTGTVNGLTAVLIDPGADPVGTATASGVQATTTGPGMPTIIRRAEWGADESLRLCDPEQSTGMAAAAVHHTASTNDYSPADVPGLIRGFYAFHTRSEATGGRGWCDIGYNFLVDKFGRVFEGRAGSIENSVVGVHTGGFNSRTIGISAIGNYATAAPTAALLDGISRTVAWKFSQHRIFAESTVTLVSGGGASKYPAGTNVTFSTIYGHRDAQLTACPGELLYSSLASIRARVAQLSNAAVTATPFGSWDGQSTSRTSVTVRGWMIDPDMTGPVTVVTSVDGVQRTSVADRDRPDVGAVYPAFGPAHGFQVEVPAAAGLHAVCISAINVGNGADRLIGCRWIRVTNPLPVGNVDSLTTTSQSIHVVGWARDPDTTSPIAVHVYVDSDGTAATADLARPDLEPFFPSSDHGFDVTVPATPGTHRVCVFGINVPAGDNPAIACRTVTVITAAPVGQIDDVRVSGGVLDVRGWALDPDTTAPVNVALYVNGRGFWNLADGSRPDLAAAFPALGTAHGFTLSTSVAPGPVQVCAVAIDTAGGPATSLGCRTVTDG